MPALVQGFIVNNGDVASASYLNTWFSTGGITISAGRALIGNSTGTTGTVGTSNWQEITMGNGLTLTSATLSVGTLTSLGVSGDTQGTIVGGTSGVYGGASGGYGIVVNGFASGNLIQSGGGILLNPTVTSTASSQYLTGVLVTPNCATISSFTGSVYRGLEITSNGSSYSTSATSGQNITFFAHAPRAGVTSIVGGSTFAVNYTGFFDDTGGNLTYIGNLQLGTSFVPGTSVASGYMIILDSQGVARKINCG